MKNDFFGMLDSLILTGGRLIIFIGPEEAYFYGEIGLEAF